MDIVQFLFAVVNLLLALVVLFGGQLIFKRLTELREDIEAIERRLPPEDTKGPGGSDPNLHWKQ